MGFLSSPIMLSLLSDITPLSPPRYVCLLGLPSIVIDSLTVSPRFPTLPASKSFERCSPPSLVSRLASYPANLYPHLLTSIQPSQKPETESDWTLDQSEIHNLRTPPAEPTSDKPRGCEASRGPRNEGAGHKEVIPTPRHAMVVLARCSTVLF
jgi:hypothetical protein